MAAGQVSSTGEETSAGLGETDCEILSSKGSIVRSRTIATEYANGSQDWIYLLGG